MFMISDKVAQCITENDFKVSLICTTNKFYYNVEFKRGGTNTDFLSNHKI